MAVRRTKAGIVESAIQLLSGNLPSAISPASLSSPLASGGIAYDSIIESELSKYTYAFCLEPYRLTPAITPDLTRYPAVPEDANVRYYTAPSSAGELLAISKGENLSTILRLAIRGKIDIPNRIGFAPIGDSLIQVSSIDDDLWLVYYTTNPEPVRMTGPFVNALRYLIASDLAPQYKESSGLRIGKYYLDKGLAEIDEAQALDSRSSSDTPDKVTLDDVIYRGRPDGSITYKYDGAGGYAPGSY